MIQNPKQKMGDKKIPLHLVPPAASIAIARGLAEGAEKYGPWNWREIPINIMTYIGSAQRHIAAYVEGEDTDPDGDGKSHLDGAIASLAIIIDAISAGTCNDDRPPISNGGVLDTLKKGSAKIGKSKIKRKANLGIKKG